MEDAILRAMRKQAKESPSSSPRAEGRSLGGCSSVLGGSVSSRPLLLTIQTEARGWVHPKSGVGIGRIEFELKSVCTKRRFMSSSSLPW